MISVLLVYDVDGWAHHHMAKGIQRYAPPQYDVTICAGDKPLNARRGQQFDAVLELSWSRWGHTKSIISTERLGVLLANMGVLYQKVTDTDWRSWIVTRLRYRDNILDRTRRAKPVIVANAALQVAMNRAQRSVTYLPAGIDPAVYCKPQGERANGTIRVGWCGNPNRHPYGVSVKGLREIVDPLVEDVPSVEWAIKDNDYTTAVPPAAMCAWYGTLDMFLCTSLSEGSPMTVLEAAACGVPVISTPVGMVPEIEPIKEFGFMVPGYHNKQTAGVTRAAFVAAVDRLRDKSLAAEYADALREYVVANFSWEVLSPKWLRAIAGG